MMNRWPLSLFGLALLVFAVVALTGPGRIDIEDGQARYEAGRCWIEYGDPSIRDPRVLWHRFPGRDGQDFTYYRFTGEVVGAAFAGLGNANSSDEGKRHFIFALNGAATASALAVAYALWFRRQGLSPRAALGWALAGIVCTPCWYYAASTFDDLLGTLFVVLALTLADRARSGHWLWLVVSAMCVGLSLNSKQPLAAVLLPALALADDATRSVPRRLTRATVLALGLFAGLALYAGYEHWKFPPEQKAKHAAIQAEWGITVFDGNVTEALLDYAVGPSAGAIWYCPTILLGTAGLVAARRAGRETVALSVAVCASVITIFFACLTFYKGGVCWGPRYLTPVFGMLWLFAPAGAALLGGRLTRILLALGATVQVLGLAIVPERIYVERNVHSGFYTVNPWWYFQPSISHLLNRPREIGDALTSPAAPEFTPSPSPTFTLPVFDPPFYTGPKGVEGVRRYTLLNELRPWWATFPHLPADERPVNVAAALAVFALLGLTGAGLLFSAQRENF